MKYFLDSAKLDEIQYAYNEKKCFISSEMWAGS